MLAHCRSEAFAGKKEQASTANLPDSLPEQAAAVQYRDSRHHVWFLQQIGPTIPEPSGGGQMACPTLDRHRLFLLRHFRALLSDAIRKRPWRESPLQKEGTPTLPQIDYSKRRSALPSSQQTVFVPRNTCPSVKHPLRCGRGRSALFAFRTNSDPGGRLPEYELPFVTSSTA